jgi:hypothetical protein
LPKDDVFTRIASCLGMGERSIRFWQFRDGMGNFELSVPEGWKYDENVAVVDGKYTISFQSADGMCQFTINVDAQLPEKFNFTKYAKAELESPTSGIFASVRKSRFHDMPAFVRDYHYASGSKKFFGGGIMFSTGSSVFSLSWSAPAERQTVMDAVFGHMKKTIVLHKGFVVSRGRGSLRDKLRQANAAEDDDDAELDGEGQGESGR